MTDFALDVSNQNPIDLATAKLSGCKLLIAKGTEGADYNDKYLAAHRKIAKTLGIGFGSYVFLHARSTGNEAQNYLNYVKPKPGEVVIIDAEVGGQDGASMWEMAKRVDSCAVVLERAGFHPLLYASADYWRQMVSVRPALKRLKIWEAQYPGLFTRWFPRLSTLRIKLGTGATVVMWQWTDRFKVEDHYYDCSRMFVPVGEMVLPK